MLPASLILPVRSKNARSCQIAQARLAARPGSSRWHTSKSQKALFHGCIQWRNGKDDGPQTSYGQRPAASYKFSSSSKACNDLQTKAKKSSVTHDWEADPDYNVKEFTDLPLSNFGVNQHLHVNQEFREALRQILWQFRAPIRYAFAYGSGVFPQAAISSPAGTSVHAHPDPAITKVQGGNGKMIDFIFGVSYTQHWHSLNLAQNRDHYSSLGMLGSSIVSSIQDRWGAGVYFHPFVTVNGTLIKYGVVNLDTLCRDLSHWNTLYLAGRLQKPVKILRDDPRVRLANQINLISALRTALLLLPEAFTERDLYRTIAGISYLGDPRMSLGTENLNKVSNIVQHQILSFRQLYAPLIDELPNVSFDDPRCSRLTWRDDPSIDAKMTQDMNPQKRGNMVRRLPQTFREKLYFRFQERLQIPKLEFDKMMQDAKDDDPTRVTRRQGSIIDRHIAADEPRILIHEVSKVLASITKWPSYSQSFKSMLTAGTARSWRYLREKWQKNREGKAKSAH